MLEGVKGKMQITTRKESSWCYCEHQQRDQMFAASGGRRAVGKLFNTITVSNGSAQDSRGSAVIQA